MLREKHVSAVLCNFARKKKKAAAASSPLLGLPRTAAGNLICRGARAGTVYPPPVVTCRDGAVAHCGSAARAVTNSVGQTYE